MQMNCRIQQRRRDNCGSENHRSPIAHGAPGQNAMAMMIPNDTSQAATITTSSQRTTRQNVNRPLASPEASAVPAASAAVWRIG